MKINEIKHRHYLAYTNELEGFKTTNGYAYLDATVRAGIKAGIIEDVPDIDELKPFEIRAISEQLTIAIREAVQPEAKN